MDIVIDFDGTCVKHSYPLVGESIGSSIVLRELVAAGHRLILSTMRHGIYLEHAVDWFRDKDIPLYGVQKNPDQKKWTKSPKAYGHIYIDDAALGCPLIYPSNERPYVDWLAIRRILVEKGILK